MAEKEPLENFVLVQRLACCRTGASKTKSPFSEKTGFGFNGAI
jgi:hypothetical protein